MKNNITDLFVYGSLRSGFHYPAFKYISDHFSFVSVGKVKGLLYDLGDYPAAVPTKDDYFIKGELYKLKEAAQFDWAIEQLDDYEGLNPEEGEKQLYRRTITDVYHNNTTTAAWIYWYNQELKAALMSRHGDTFDYLSYKTKQ